MLRLACLLLSFSGAPSLCADPEVGAVTPAAESATVKDCAAQKPAESAAATESGSRVRTAHPYWHRLLPGMFR